MIWKGVQSEWAKSVVIFFRSPFISLLGEHVISAPLKNYDFVSPKITTDLAYSSVLCDREFPRSFAQLQFNWIIKLYCELRLRIRGATRKLLSYSNIGDSNIIQ